MKGHWGLCSTIMPKAMMYLVIIGIFKCLWLNLTKSKMNLTPPIMDSMLNSRNITYNFKPLLEFQSEKKRTVFDGLETLSYRVPQLWILSSEEIKQRNTIYLFKSEVKQQICKERPCRLCKVCVPNAGFIWHMAPIFSFFFC